jgi:hypothetical protein
MYNRIDSERVNVFHAMKCRKSFLPMISNILQRRIKTMAYMTEEEADALDEELTRTTPNVDFSKSDVFIRQRELLTLLDPMAADYIMTRALDTHKPPAQIISDMVRERITAAAEG